MRHLSYLMVIQRCFKKLCFLIFLYGGLEVIQNSQTQRKILLPVTMEFSWGGLELRLVFGTERSSPVWEFIFCKVIQRRKHGLFMKIKVRVCQKWGNYHFLYLTLLCEQEVLIVILEWQFAFCWIWNIWCAWMLYVKLVEIHLNIWGQRRCWEQRKIIDEWSKNGK